MARFRRNRNDEAAVESPDAGESTDGAAETAPAFVNAPLAEVADEDPPFSRDAGPWDISEAPESERPRLDLGGLQLLAPPGLEMRIEVDQESGNVVSVGAVTDDSSIQIQVFAAPRHERIWREVRGEIAAGIVESGGKADETAGTFGRELLALIPVEAPGGHAMQEVRFVGIDGPRWFLRGVFNGKAYQSGAMPQLELVLRECVVVRGDVPMAPKDPLPLRMPDLEDATVLEPPGREPLEPFKRGPEITEIH